ncbi:MAG: TIGR02300 family protein, partial [Pseudomonadota bacterium]
MTKPELGTKRDCPECGARFYDLHKEPAHCPKCHNEFIPEALLKPRKTRVEEEKPVNTEDEDTAEENENVTSLDEADAENRNPASKRKTALDEDDSTDDGDADSSDDDE